MMRRLLAILLVAGLLSGCAAMKGIFTEPTGQITMERQEFIDAWALVQVLGEDFFALADAACADRTWPADRCRKLPEAKRQAAAIVVGVRAKLAVPESRVDWGTVMKFLGVLTSLR
ncbi:MAG TPA: hypothetical protein DCP69_07255 [Candidatus Omnitrophica bacterium]|nr:hypothetical protein [Candidatus Omnitrophota bacterium]